MSRYQSTSRKEYSGRNPEILPPVPKEVQKTKINSKKRSKKKAKPTKDQDEDNFPD